jgi:hypothetical protein
MLLFRSDPFGGTHELLPCGLLGGDLVKLFRKNKSKYYWYDFTVRGKRYRGSTKETNETRAEKAAADAGSVAYVGTASLPLAELRSHISGPCGVSNPREHAPVPQARAGGALNIVWKAHRDRGHLRGEAPRPEIYFCSSVRA